MDQLTFTFLAGLVVAGAFLAFLHTKNGRKWLENL